MLRALVTTVSLAGSVFAQGPDLAAMQQWLQSETVTWAVVGEYDAETWTLTPSPD